MQSGILNRKSLADTDHASSVRWFKSRGAPLMFIAILIVAGSLAAYRVFLVPILQSPDEEKHLDYTLNIYSAGRPYTAPEPYRKWNTSPAGYHVFTWYLMKETNGGI